MRFIRSPKVCSRILLPCVLSFGAAMAVAQQPAATPQAWRKSESPSKGAAATEENPYHEDFASLPVKGSSLKLELAILGEVDDKPGLPFVRERWHLEWRPGDPIDVYIVKPKGVQNPPVILYLYSYPQDTDRFKEDLWCDYVTSNGFGAVGFVSALTGHRLEHRPPRDDFFTQLPEAIGGTVHDVQMILDFIEKRKAFDMNRVGMFGQGSGGAIAILASAADPRIKAVDTLTPWGNWPAFAKSSTFVPAEDRLQINTPEFLAGVASIDPVQWLPKVKARSLRIQNVRKDGHMPDECQENLEAAAPETTEINQYGDGAALVPQAQGGRLLDWIKSQLQPDAKPQVALDKSQRIHFFPPRMKAPSPGSPY